MNTKPFIFALSLLPLSVLACEKVQVSGYDEVGCFSEGLAGVQKNGERGFIDKTGKVVIPIKYDRAWNFENGKAVAMLNGETFYIDKTGNRMD